MEWKQVLDVLKVHCQGEIGNVVMAGAPALPGDTLLAQMNYLNDTDDSLRRFLTLEPRAHPAMSVNLLVEPRRAGADAGFIVLQADRAHPMSGSNCICVVTALLESGRVPMREGENEIRLDTPAGLITARAMCRRGRCESVSLRNVPAFAVELDRPVQTPAWGAIKVDIAFGGVFYALVDAEQLGLAIAPAHARRLAQAGVAIKAQLNRELTVSHPDMPALRGLSYVMFRQPGPDGVLRTCTVLDPGRVDRSPCGTGSSANLAAAHARGEIAPGQSRLSRSIIGGEFRLDALEETTVGGRPAIVPKITGSAWIQGREWLRRDASDPFPQGFALPDLGG